MKDDQAVIKDISTLLGNTIIDSLKSEQWKLVSQYSPLAFDKGIDYDFYVLRRNGHQLKFEWDNWFEWQVSGDKAIIVEISRRFSIR